MFGSEAARPGGEEPLDLRLLPLGAAAWAGAWWGTAPGLAAGVAILGAALAGAVLLWRRGQGRRAMAALAVLVLCGSMGAARSHQLATSHPGRLADERAMATVVVRTTSDVRLHPRRGVLPESATVPARVLVVAGRGQASRQSVEVTVRATGEAARGLVRVPAGSTIRLDGRLARPDPGQRWAAVVTIRSPPAVLAPPGPFAGAVNRLRDGLRESMRHNRPQQAGLLPSLVVGDTSRLDPALEERFKDTALTHLTAVSGTNISLTLVFLLGLARWVGIRGWWVRITGVVGVVCFVVVCRAEPSVLRAGAMGLVALAGVGLAGGRGRGLRHLCVAVWLLLMADPWLSRSVGFALSTLATAGILWWGRRWSQSMAWAPAWLAESVAIPLAAQLATQPVVTSISGSVSVVGLAANALAGPFVGPATVLGLLTALVAPVWGGLASWIGWAAGWCVQPIIWVATTGGALPAATWRWPAQPALLGLLTGACLLVAVVVPRLLASRVACLVMAAALTLASVRSPQPLGWPGQWQAAFCDVGQGDATVLRAGPGQAVLVDVGPEPGPTLACLRALGVREIALLVVSHYHDDHIQGLEGLLAQLPVRRALLNPARAPAAGADRVWRLLAARGTAIDWASIGQGYRVGDVLWTTVGVGAQAVLATTGEGENSAENDSSIIGLAEVNRSPGPGLRLALGGDVEPAGQQRVVGQGWRPGLQVLKMPHHGSSRQDERFWCGSGARLAVASAGFRNGYGHPAGKALKLADRCGMRVARTDLQGTVTVWHDGRSLQVRAQRDGPP
ncbi:MULTISPECIES: ComEC/Rec2 family competence protein [unclassified Luteococcus]|uniref:ComEC/Rec2 family competence protein n=1 Tax=unclassified Luteococcus TaxID=2639923 RepID=UPI00313EEDDD